MGALGMVPDQLREVAMNMREAVLLIALLLTACGPQQPANYNEYCDRECRRADPSDFNNR